MTLSVIVVGLLYLSVSLSSMIDTASPRLALPYRWRQELGEVDVTVPVPKGTRGKDLNVQIKKTYLSVGFKGKEPILAGDLAKDIKVDESTWTLGVSYA